MLGENQREKKYQVDWVRKLSIFAKQSKTIMITQQLIKEQTNTKGTISYDSLG